MTKADPMEGSLSRAVDVLRMSLYSWWAVDQDSNVLDILVQQQRDKKAAKQFFRTLLKGLTYGPGVTLSPISSNAPVLSSGKYCLAWSIGVRMAEKLGIPATRY